MKTLYRLELDSGHGMWYDNDGKFDPIIQKICPDSINAKLPMDYSEQYKLDNLIWKSSVSNLKSMLAWFPDDDMNKLMEHGFKLYKYEVERWIELEKGEIIFATNSVISKSQIFIG